LGYWRKLKMLRGWYVSEVAAAEVSAAEVSVGSGVGLERGDEVLDSRLLEVTGECQDDAWLSLASPEDLLTWAVDTW
jgi:hypothetical protein